MAFDQPTRNRLQRFVNDARRVLEEEFTRQLQNDFGLDPNAGTVADLASLRHINDAQRETARILRDTLAHYCGQWFGSSDRWSVAGDQEGAEKLLTTDHRSLTTASDHRTLATVLDRIVREQAFTVLNRLAALRMAESRGLLVESVGNGFQAKGFQLYARLAGAGLGETGDAYRVYLFSVFDELAQDLPGLFDRYSPQGRLFPREAALLQVLNLINDADIAPLWSEDETLGWIYQYFNSKEERKAMREASQAPRNSRELAVRNQFFTPRYVVEFLVDNTLGRLWFNATGGQTSLRERCQYLLVASGQWPVVGEESPATDHRPLATALRDPRTLKLLDPACGSMHFGLYAFDLFAEIYREAWDFQLSVVGGQWSEDVDEQAKILSGIAGLAESHGLGGSSVRVHQGVSEGGNLWTDQPVAAGGCLGTVEHSRGAGTELDSTVSASSVDRLWVAHGNRNPDTDRPSSAVSQPNPDAASLGASRGSREDVERLVRRALEKANWSLTTDHRPLLLDYPSKDEYLKDIPRLIIEHNLYGVDIDPRAAQIASLALWLRAQRAWHEAGVKAKDRPPIGRGHVVAAIAPPAERELRQQFAANLDPLDAELFEKTLSVLKGLPELGVLLQVERELPRLVREVYGEHGPLFQAEDMEQWQRAETRLRAALTAFTHAARTTYQGRLFAQDALQGLRLIDLCREVFDVVVMNPPFGALSSGAKQYLTDRYENSSNDLLAIFVDRGLSLLRPGGRLGAITSRTCFFVNSYSEWRRQVVLKHATLEALADLGHGVMDDAMVEAAAYVLSHGQSGSNTKVLRAIASTDRQAALNECLAAYRSGGKDVRIFDVNRAAFEILPDSPFVYWAHSSTLKKLASFPAFEPSVAQVRKGLRTGDNFRFVRALWEIGAGDLTPGIIGTDSAAKRESSNWVPLVLSGSSQPWFSPLLVALNWKSNGKELRQYVTKYGSPSRLIQAEDFYFKPGMSWTLRAARFVPYVIPSGCIPTGSRPMAFPTQGKETQAIAVSASRVASAFMRFYGDWFTRPKFLEGKLKLLPWPKIEMSVQNQLDEMVRKEYAERRKSYQHHEPFYDFIVPLDVLKTEPKDISIEWRSLLGSELESVIEKSFNLADAEASELYRELDEALLARSFISDSDEDDDSDDGSEFILDISARSRSESNISYAVGCAFGRWDVRFATGEKSIPSFSDPFAPLTTCPPGLLQNERGLPPTPDEIVTLTHKAAYPIKVAKKGILVDDPGHDLNFESSVLSALKVVWPSNKWESVERKACDNLGIRSLREYFRKPSGFFSDHLGRYTKSRRRAPIYWALSTVSCSYTLWLYYPSLTNQTLYTAINDFVEPKLQQVSTDVATLRSKGSARTRDDEKQFEALQAFELELIQLRDTLLKLAPTYQPNHDDGVQISAAPLWSMFRHKPWQKVLKDTWAKLEKGNYDWAHLAMNYWPDRVREKCKTDKSLAIAHGLEHLYVEPEAAPKKPRGKKKAG